MGFPKGGGGKLVAACSGDRLAPFSHCRSDFMGLSHRNVLVRCLEIPSISDLRLVDTIFGLNESTDFASRRA
jgi:hypothetical protein